jgi:hypothetical protein
MNQTTWVKGVSRPGLRAAMAVVLAFTLSLVPDGGERDSAFASDLSPAFSQARVQDRPDAWSSMTIRETFDDFSTGVFPSPSTRPIGTFTRSGDDVGINASQEWGGANSSKFPNTNGGSLTLSLSSATNFKYIGFWWSAGSGNNRICLQNATQTGTTGSSSCLAEYSTTELLASSSFNPALYNGNPNLFIGNETVPNGTADNAANRCREANATINPNRNFGHCGEPFAFIHIFYDAGFAKVTFSGGGFEFDNVTASTEESFALIDALPSGTLIGADSAPAYSLTAARVVPVDPRSSDVSFPGVILGGAATNQPNATLCLTQVTNSQGNVPVALSDTNLRISVPIVSGITRNLNPPRFTLTGSQTTVRDLVSQIQIVSSTVNRSVASGASVFIRVSVQARLNAGNTSCQSSTNVITSTVVELRPLRLSNVNQLGIPLD